MAGFIYYPLLGGEGGMTAQEKHLFIACLGEGNSFISKRL